MKRLLNAIFISGATVLFVLLGTVKGMPDWYYALWGFILLVGLVYALLGLGERKC